MNWSVIESNLTEARDTLDDLIRMARSPRRRSEVDLEVLLAHAYHHLNFAWHVRRVTSHRYSNLTDRDFDRWGAFPKDIELNQLGTSTPKRRGA